MKQEQEDHSKSYENNKESIEALDQTTATLRRKTMDLESPAKRKWGISADIDEEIPRHRTPPPLHRGIGGCHVVTTGPTKGTCTIQNDPRMCYTSLRNT